jgi:large subunit ribosomal protein L35
MPKMKTRRSALKRFKLTGSGKLKRSQAYHNHELSKAGASSGALAGTSTVDKSDHERILRMLPNGSR